MATIELTALTVSPVGFLCSTVMQYIAPTTFDSPAGDARNLLQECYTTQRVRSERDANLTNVIRADHEFYCSNTAPVNHKVTRGVTEILHELVHSVLTCCPWLLCGFLQLPADPPEA